MHVGGLQIIVFLGVVHLSSGFYTLYLQLHINGTLSYSYNQLVPLSVFYPI